MTKPSRKLKVFLCHATQDKPLVRDLYQRLSAEGWIDPWLDEEKLLPGMDWEYEIEKELDASDAVCVCVSNMSVSKEGFVQRELRFVIDIALEKPEGAIYILPVRLEDCQPPRKLRTYHYADYFPPERHDWAYGRLLKSLEMRAATLGIGTEKVSAAPEAPKALEPAPETVAQPDRLTILGMEFVKIPAGKFLMGRNNDDKLAAAIEKPQHTLELSDYWMGRYPVTNEQYARFRATERNHPVKDWHKKLDHPVVNVSWHDAQAYLKWFNQSLQEIRRSGDSSLTLPPSDFIFRLPTEAEWEKAARGPNGNSWPWGNQFDPAKCNSVEGRKSGTTPVGLYSPLGDSPYGCADMSGNVWEWTQSLHKPYQYRVDDGRDDLHASAGDRGLRGGSWNYDRDSAHVAYRNYSPPHSRNDGLGFRVMMFRPPS